MNPTRRDTSFRFCSRVRSSLLAFLLTVFVGFGSGLNAQQIVPFGAGSYASAPPKHEDLNGEGVDVNTVSAFLNKGLFIDASKAGEAVPTNDWWTDLIFSRYSGNMWAYPLTVSTNAQGLDVYLPIEFAPDGREMLTEFPIGIRGYAEIVLEATDTILADFEGGTFPPGWSVSGTAFGNSPSAGTLTGQSVVSGFSGSGLANSFHGGDGPVGSLASPPFTVNANYIHSQLGGGNHPGLAGMRLIKDGAVVRSATGANSEVLDWVSWDVSDLVGETVTLEVFDNVSGGWGHTMVDQLVMTNDVDPATKFSTSFAPASAVALDWSDWEVQFRMAQNPTTFFDVTMGHGFPFVWVEATGVRPLLDIDPSAAFFDASGNALTLPFTTSRLAVEIQGRTFGLHVPDGTGFENVGGEIILTFAGAEQYLVISALPGKGSLLNFDNFAYAVPRDTTMDWSYDPVDGFVRTNWTVTAEALKGSSTTVLQGWIPHHYRETSNDLAFTGDSFLTPRGKLKLVASNSARIDFPFSGIAPNLPAPKAIGGAHDYSRDRMESYLQNYTTNTGYGGDTYWGGKSLTQWGDYLAMADDMGSSTKQSLLTSLRGALANWLTYDGVEKEKYFAHYPSYGALVGFNESYGSSQFTDHHFHYGYFTRASAMLGFQDPQFLVDYGPMIRLVAKQYANWDRTDGAFPFLRTFDPWKGHSYAGGTSSGNGNNQESSSESMQSWSGLFLLGEAMNDPQMAAAGAMGHAIERLAIKEYWNDYHGNPAATKPVPGDGGTLPAAYDHDMAGIVFDGGPAFATFFSGDPLWMYGIQWLPIHAGLAYLGEDPAFAKSQFASMIADRVPTMGGSARGVIRDYNLAPARTEWNAGQFGPALEKLQGAVKIAYEHNPSYTTALAASNPLYDSATGELYFEIGPNNELTFDPAVWNSTALPASLVPPADGQPLEGWPLFDALYTNYNYDEAFLADRWEFDVLGYQSGVDTEQAKKVIGDQGDGLGNVLLGFMAHYDPEIVAELMDEFYEDGHPIGVGNGTSGLTYYNTHSLRSLGHIIYDRHVDIPTSSVFFNDATGEYSYVVYNASDSEQTATVYSGQSAVGSFPVPPRTTVQHGLDQALTSLVVTRSNESATIPPGTEVAFAVSGLDQYGASHPLDSVSWSVSAGGSISSAGLFSAESAVDPVVVTVTADGLTQTEFFRVDVAPVLKKIQIEPEFARVPTGGSQVFSAQGLDQYGDEYPLTALTWSVGGGGTIDATGRFDSDGSTGAFYVMAANDTASETAMLTVHPPLANVALNKTVDSSSALGNNGEESVNDGDPTTRWESEHGIADGWIQVDLGAAFDVDRVVIDWEGAFASNYELQISNDGVTWETLLEVQKSSPADDELPVDVTTRYIRMQGVELGTGYGYSIFELEVYGAPSASAIAATAIYINPPQADLMLGTATDFDAYAFDANWAGGPTDLIDWQAADGVIDATGLYTADTAGGPFELTATFLGAVSGGGALTATAYVTVLGGQLVNVAPMGSATASSSENGAMGPAMAIDGDSLTRWSSAFADAEQITVDLGEELFVDSVLLRWEAAFGEDYEIQVSTDGLVWDTAASVVDGDGGDDEILIGRDARHVRMQGVTRGTPYGYSLYEFEIYAAGATSQPPVGGNLAAGRPAFSSTNETGYLPESAFDGDGGTRWSSAFDDDQWIYVDLGAVQTISRVVLNWEGAYGSKYKIQTSNDAVVWDDVAEETSGDGGVDEYTTPASARFVRLLGLERASQWGYSLFEFEVY